MSVTYVERLARDFLTALEDDMNASEPDERWPDLGEAFQFWFKDSDAILLTAGRQILFLQTFIVLQMLIATDPELAHLRRYIEVPARFGEDGSLPEWLGIEAWDCEVFAVTHPDHYGQRRTR